jgi:hypothetical protein
LRAVKLGALVRDHWPALTKNQVWCPEPSDLPGGAALRDADSGQAWVLIDDAVVSRFGAALAWAWRHGVGELHVLVEAAVPGGPGGASGVMARRAGAMAHPPAVWDVRGRGLTEAAPAEGGIDDRPSDVEAGAVYRELLVAHGAEPVFEHGVLRGEVLGLEVARVVGGQLQVGVGRHDRLARAEMHPDQDLGQALDEAVLAVRSRRRPGEARHPANTLARGRWLRSIVCARPELAGAGDLRPVAPPLPWFDLPEAGAAPACGTSLDGNTPVVVVCSVGVDLDLIPTAADSRLIHRPDAHLVVVVPERDDLPVTRGLAGSLAAPAEVRVVPRTWEGLA